MYDKNGMGDFMDAMAQMDRAAQHKRLEPANPAEFMEYVGQELRKHQSNYIGLANRYQAAANDFKDATVGLGRLRTLVKVSNQPQLQHIEEMHLNQQHITRGSVFNLEKCKTILADTSNVSQLIGETLNNPLADKHKKVAMQKELALRLDDLDKTYAICKASVEKQETLQKQLSKAVQDLLHDAKVKLPPNTKREMHLQDEVDKIASKYRPSKQQVATTKQASEIAAKSLGDQVTEPSKSSDMLKCVVALAVGVALGVVILKRK